MLLFQRYGDKPRPTDRGIKTAKRNYAFVSQSSAFIPHSEESKDLFIKGIIEGDIRGHETWDY